MHEQDEDMLNELCLLRGNFNNQVHKLLLTVRLRRDVNLNKVFDDIEHTFNKIWPGCTAKPFGSIVTGLALKSSDIDRYLQRQPAQCHETPEECAMKAEDSITDSPSPFREVSVIQKRFPVVKFLHEETRKSCDLSFNGEIAVEFSKLMRRMLVLDDRVLKLAMLVKCWAKIHNVTGRRRLPSSALMIFVISFLQEKKILPSVASLQTNVSSNMIDGWNTAFAELPYESYNTESVYNLLGEFFNYYKHFEYRTLIVCPYLGYPVERDSFMDVTGVLPEFQLYKENINTKACEAFFLRCIMCVQDPFNHARNCAGPVRPQVAKEIIHQFTRAASVFEQFPKNRLLNCLFSFNYETRIPEYRERHWLPHSSNGGISMVGERRRRPTRHRNQFRGRR